MKPYSNDSRDNRDYDRSNTPRNDRNFNSKFHRSNFPSFEHKRQQIHRGYRPRYDTHGRPSLLENATAVGSLAKQRQNLLRFKVYKTMDNYELGNQVGEGTYGQVFKAKNKETSKYVALKKLYLKEDEKGKEKNRDGFPITGIREIEILRSLDHLNIVELEAMVSMSTGIENMDMYMVFEYMDHDLTGVLNNTAVVFQIEQIKCLSEQLFRGLEYLHRKQIIHRDIKGANLLLNREGYLKIADFGLARRLHLDRDSGLPLQDFEYTNRVVTLWYRSPELLLGSTKYSFEVDIWSAGCILMEFYTRFAIFQGRTELDQLDLIFKLCGTPTDQNWPTVKSLPWYGLLKFPHSERVLHSEFRNSSYGLSERFVDLIDRLLTLDPAQRPTARQALEHDWFTIDLPKACPPSEYFYFLHSLPRIDGDWHEFEGKMRKKNKGVPVISTNPAQESSQRNPPMGSSENLDSYSTAKLEQSKTPVARKSAQYQSPPDRRRNEDLRYPKTDDSRLSKYQSSQKSITEDPSRGPSRNTSRSNSVSPGNRKRVQNRQRSNSPVYKKQKREDEVTILAFHDTIIE